MSQPKGRAVRATNTVPVGDLDVHAGALRPDPSRPGLGLAVKWADLEEYRVTA
jgi:hypothetical protein